MFQLSISTFKSVDRDPSSFEGRGNAVSNRILDQELKNHLRHQRHFMATFYSFTERD